MRWDGYPMSEASIGTLGVRIYAKTGDIEAEVYAHDAATAVRELGAALKAVREPPEGANKARKMLGEE